MKPTNYFRGKREDMLAFIPERRARTLEVGCGEGAFISSLDGIQESWGIEPSEAAVVAREHVSHVFQATFDDAEHSLPPGYFDLIICNDVIEHLPDHFSFLLRIKKYIAPGGIIVGSIPNIRFYNNLFQLLLEKDWYYTDTGVLDRTHLAFFTHKSFERTLKQCGFEILRLEGINTDFVISNSTRERTYLFAARALTILTLGHCADIRHLQFGFQAMPIKEPRC